MLGDVPGVILMLMLLLLLLPAPPALPSGVARSPAAPVGVGKIIRPVSYMVLSDFLIRSHQALIWEKYNWLRIALQSDGSVMVGGGTLKKGIRNN